MNENGFKNVIDFGQLNRIKDNLLLIFKIMNK